MTTTSGLHHITAVAKNPQMNVDFYAKVLGQRLVKTTVNFDDPGTYHLYYGDASGGPGTIMTFFPWPHIVKGQAGAGETGAVAYNIPADSYNYWMDRLASFDLHPVAGGTRFGERTILFDDPDGMHLELIETNKSDIVQHWNDGPVAQHNALQGFHGVTLWLAETEGTAQLLTEQLGYTLVGTEGSRSRYKSAGDHIGRYIDLLHTPALGPGKFGAGSIHHIAFRAADDAEQATFLSSLKAAGHMVTPVKDRQYFHSIYFRSPGGVLFEIATDIPGFLFDEPIDALGQSLKLPPWLETRREQIEQALPQLNRSY